VALYSEGRRPERETDYHLRSSAEVKMLGDLHPVIVRGPFEKFVDWRQCTAVMPSCSRGDVVVA
jgi:hypothetical protein